MFMEKLELKIPPAVQVIIAWLFTWLLTSFAPITHFEFAIQTSSAIALFVLGLTIIVVCGLGFFKKKTTVDPRDPSQTSALVIAGLYHYSRNPMYVGFLMMVIAFAIYMGSLAGILTIPLFIWYMNRFQIIPEEQFLQEKFADAYKDYTKSVRRWL